MVILQKHFYWPKLRYGVSKYIISCTACSISKPAIKKQSLYTPLPTPERPWESILMDYMSGLLSTKQGNDCAFVVVDQFSKIDILTAYKKDHHSRRYYQALLLTCVGPLGYHRPSSPIGTASSSAHFGQVSDHCWTPSSLNPLFSTPTPTAKQMSPMG
jgi:hypothetical protein